MNQRPMLCEHNRSSRWRWSHLERKFSTIASYRHSGDCWITRKYSRLAGALRTNARHRDPFPNCIATDGGARRAMGPGARTSRRLDYRHTRLRCDGGSRLHGSGLDSRHIRRLRPQRYAHPSPVFGHCDGDLCGWDRSGLLEIWQSKAQVVDNVTHHSNCCDGRHDGPPRGNACPRKFVYSLSNKTDLPSELGRAFARELIAPPRLLFLRSSNFLLLSNPYDSGRTGFYCPTCV
jgi:hypothetical protein